MKSSEKPGLWLLVAVPASLWAIDGGWIAAVMGIGICAVVVAALGSGRPIESVEAAIPITDPVEPPVVRVSRRPPIATPTGLAMARLGNLGMEDREPLAEVAGARASGAAFATAPLRK